MFSIFLQSDLLLLFKNMNCFSGAQTPEATVHIQASSKSFSLVFKKGREGNATKMLDLNHRTFLLNTFHCLPASL